MGGDTLSTWLKIVFSLAIVGNIAIGYLFFAWGFRVSRGDYSEADTILVLYAGGGASLLIAGMIGTLIALYG